MRVLTIMSKLEMGGIEKTLLSCIPYLKRNGVEMTILCSVGGELDGEYENLGVSIIDFGNNKIPFKDARYLERILKSHKFDVVHSRYGHTSGLFAKVCAKFGVPFLISIHNEKAMFKNSWIGNPMLRFIRSAYLNYHKKLSLKYATKIIGHSKANLRYYTDNLNLEGHNNSFAVLYNGVDFSKFISFPALTPDRNKRLDEFVLNSNKVLIHIGSFKEQKNHTVLIDIFHALKPKENNYKLILLGIGGLIDCIKQKVEFYKLQEYVYFVGMELNIAPYLFASDLFIFPSLYEGFGNVLIEAQYANLPIVASKIAPHYEASSSVYHEYFFDPKDVNAAVQSVEELLSSDNSKKIVEARKFSETFTIQQMADNLMNIYKGSINESYD